MRFKKNIYKLLVVDVDGTLVGREGSISAENKNALARAGARGIKVALSTGRVVPACLGIISQLSLDGYHIFFDGALVSNPKSGKEVYAQPLQKGLLRRAVAFAHSQDIYLELYSVTDYFVEHEHWSIDIHRKFFGIEPALVDFTQLWDRERIIKGELVVSSAEEVSKAERFQLQFSDSLRFSWASTPAYPDVHFINVVDPGVSKGKALEALSSYLGVPLSEVMVIGDGTNDLPIFSLAGRAIAMGNAPDEVKGVADYVTLDVDQNGLAVAIEKFLL